MVRIRLGSVGWTNGRRFGDIWLGLWLWKLLSLDEIVDRHVPQGKETVRPADIVAIEVINRLCGPCSEFALAEHWYASTGLEDLLGVPDSAVTKDRLYRTLDRLLAAQDSIEQDLKARLGTLFQLDYDLLLYDLTSTYFEGLAVENDLASRGYSRDHRSDCKQIVLALVVTRDGFPLAHRTLAGNTQDLQTVETIVTEVEQQFGKTERIWVMDRGMISKESLAFLKRPGRRYVLAARRGELVQFQSELQSGGWQQLPENIEVQVKLIRRKREYYLLARSGPRRKKERAIRRRQRHGLVRGLRRLEQLIASGRLKKRDTILERVGRLTGRYPEGPHLRHDYGRHGQAGGAELDVEGGEVQSGSRPRRGLLAAEQPIRVVSPGVVGNIHATDGGGTCVPRAEERIAVTPSVAPLQWTDKGPRDGLRVGLRVMEDAGSLIQAGGARDRDSKA